MMALDYGGCCHGVAFRLSAGDDHAQMLRLLRREASYKEDLLSIRWVDVQTGNKKFRTLTFWAAPRSKGYYVNLPLEEQAQRLARAAGHLGTSRILAQHNREAGRIRHPRFLSLAAAETGRR
jgi:cation transport protein ChaC